MQQHKIVSRDEWIAARKALMAREKELTQAREALSQERRDLPWVKVDKDYVFDGPDGKVTLGDLFKGRPQLVVQHVMFAPEWDAACKSCSFWVDGFDRMAPHLAARDTTMVAISLAPLAKLEAFKQRMGWTFDWVSSGANDFNYDYGVSFTQGQIDAGDAKYNYGTTPLYGPELPGISVFFRDEKGSVFHTYSTFARGLDMMNAAYHYLDLTPLGRHEEGLPYPMDWVRLRDQYQPAPVQASCCHS
ncbi:MAG TPA: thioredoxin family protein [Bradyrhizobium sp.]